MNLEQIKAINDAMSFLSIMTTLDNDDIRQGMDVHSKNLINAEVDEYIVDHFDAITGMYYDSRTTFCLG